MMKSSTTGQLRDPNIALRARNALRASMAALVAFLTWFGLFAYLAQTSHNGQLYVLAAIAFISSAMSALALHYSRKKQVETAVYVLLGGIVLFCPTATLSLSGVGILLGVSSALAILMLATFTLIPPQLRMANTVGFIHGIALILLDIFLPSSRLEVQIIKIYLPIAAITSIGFFSYYFLQQFSTYPFRTKLILFFVLVAIFSVGAVAVITNILVRNSITQLVGRSQQDLAERLAFETSKELEVNVDTLQAAGTQFEETAARLSDLHVGENDAIIARIIDLDDRWRVVDDKDLLIRGVINNEVSDELREFQEIFPHHVELFVTDKYGANIAATNRTSDYYQADEAWWQAAYNSGQGKVYIGQPEFDESSQTYSVIIAT